MTFSVSSNLPQIGASPLKPIMKSPPQSSKATKSSSTPNLGELLYESLSVCFYGALIYSYDGTSPFLTAIWHDPCTIAPPTFPIPSTKETRIQKVFHQVKCWALRAMSCSVAVQWRHDTVGWTMEVDGPAATHCQRRIQPPCKLLTINQRAGVML